MTRRVLRPLAAAPLAVLALLLPAGVAGASHLDDPPRRSVPIDDPIPGHIQRGAIQLELQTVAEGGGLTAPNWGTTAPGHPGLLFVSDQDGPLWAINTATGRKVKFLDTSPLLVPLGAFGPGTFDERGFLGVAFDPAYARNGRLYTYTSELPGKVVGQPNHTSFVREWVVPNPGADPMALRDGGAGVSGAQPRRVLLRQSEPQFNHNAGALFFRPGDAHLYVTLGDGGCADDQHGQQDLTGTGPCISHEGAGNAQNPNTLLGKLVRIDLASGTPEIFAKGFRNPFRASADRRTGEIWLADVGQNHLEEIDARIQQGGNYGWRVKEGTFLFNPAGHQLFGFASDGFPWQSSPGRPAGLIDPVAEYDHDEGVAVVGGFVYRGAAVPELRGKYVFGDYSRRPNNGNGEVFYLDESDRADVHERTPKVFHLTNGPINLFVLGFGQDARGELYVLANKKGIPFGDEGVVMKLVRRCAAGTDCRD